MTSPIYTIALLLLSAPPELSIAPIAFPSLTHADPSISTRRRRERGAGCGVPRACAGTRLAGDAPAAARGHGAGRLGVHPLVLVRLSCFHNHHLRIVSLCYDDLTGPLRVRTLVPLTPARLPSREPSHALAPPRVRVPSTARRLVQVRLSPQLVSQPLISPLTKHTRVPPAHTSAEISLTRAVTQRVTTRRVQVQHVTAWVRRTARPGRCFGFHPRPSEVGRARRRLCGGPRR